MPGLPAPVYLAADTSPLDGFRALVCFLSRSANRPAAATSRSLFELSAAEAQNFIDPNESQRYTAVQSLPMSFANLIRRGLWPVRSEFCTFDAELSTVNSQQGLGSSSVHARSLEMQTHRKCPPKRITPLEYALTKNVPATPLECALANSLDLKCPGMNTYKKGGVGGHRPCLGKAFLPSALPPVLRVSTDEFPPHPPHEVHHRAAKGPSCSR